MKKEVVILMPKEKVLIRKGAIKDLKAVQELNLLLFKKEQKEYEPAYNLKWTFGPVGTEVFTRNLSEKDRCAFIAEINGKVIGYIAGRLLSTDRYASRTVENFAEIDNMFVLEKYRGKGIGTQLVKAFLKWSKARKVDRIKVVTAAKNKKGQNFYKQNGFKEHDIVLEAKLKN